MRFIGSALGAIAALALLAGFIGGSSTAEAARFTLRGVATGAEENPALAGGATVQVTLSFDDVTMDLTYAATVSGLSSDQVTAAHFHRGARGVNGPVVYTLSATGFTQISGTVRVNAGDVADIRAGNFYFNAHSKDNPGGFARLQMVWAPAPVAQPAAITSLLPPGPGGPGMAQAQPSGRGPTMTQGRTQGRPGQSGPGQRPGVTPPRTGDAGLAAANNLLPLIGLAAFAFGGAGVLAVARKQS